MSTTDRQLTQRNGSLSDLVTLLREQHAAKLDVVIAAAGIRSSGGRWQIDGTGAAVLGPESTLRRSATRRQTERIVRRSSGEGQGCVADDAAAIAGGVGGGAVGQQRGGAARSAGPGQQSA